MTRLVLILVLFPLLSCVPPSRLTGADDTAKLDPLEREVFLLVNRHRAAIGQRELVIDSILTQHARKHSLDMAAKVVPVGHVGFDDRSRRIMKQIRCREIAENVASLNGFSDPVQEALRGWLESEEHRVNIEGRFTLTGVGIAVDRQGTYYFTQLFVLE